MHRAGGPSSRSDPPGGLRSVIPRESYPPGGPAVGFPPSASFRVRPTASCPRGAGSDRGASPGIRKGSGTAAGFPWKRNGKLNRGGGRPACMQRDRGESPQGRHRLRPRAVRRARLAEIRSLFSGVYTRGCVRPGRFGTGKTLEKRWRLPGASLQTPRFSPCNRPGRYDGQ